MDEEIFNLGLPILGICYGMQLTAKYFKGEILSSPKREYGKMNILIEDKSLLFKDLYDEEEVWMSHGDHVAKIPQGFKLLAKSQNGLVASIANEEKKIYCVQFHPEVRHTVNGNKMLHNFVFEICHANNNWSMKNYLDMQIEQIRKTVKDKKVLCGLSGGVDSTVVAVLLHKAIGHNLTCMFIDHGLLRQNEGDEVMAACKKFDMNVIRINAKERFYRSFRGLRILKRSVKLLVMNLYIASMRNHVSLVILIFLLKVHYIQMLLSQVLLPLKQLNLTIMLVDFQRI